MVGAWGPRAWARLGKGQARHLVSSSGPESVPLSTVHRIGRTGRSGNTGIATTFINKACGESVTRATLAIPRVPCLWPPRFWPQGPGWALMLPHSSTR